MISNKLLKLARLIKCITEVATDKGMLITDGEFAVGMEVFVTDEETGDLIPAPAGEYIADEQIITVNEQGIIEKIEEKQQETPIEDMPAEPEETPAEEEIEQEEETPAEEEETPAEDEEDKDAKIAELQGLLDAANAKIAELEAIIADYKEKEQETPESIEEEDRNIKTPQLTRAERMMNALKNK